MTASGTYEAEYVTLSELVKRILFLRLVQDFMEPTMRIGAVHVFEDNEGAIKLAVNKHASRRTKQIDMKQNLVKDPCDAGNVRVVDVRTEDQHADLFTKPLELVHQTAGYAKSLQACDDNPQRTVMRFKFRGIM